MQEGSLFLSLPSSPSLLSPFPLQLMLPRALSASDGLIACGLGQHVWRRHFKSSPPRCPPRPFASNTHILTCTHAPAYVYVNTHTATLPKSESEALQHNPTTQIYFAFASGVHNFTCTSTRVYHAQTCFPWMTWRSQSVCSFTDVGKRSHARQTPQ